MTEDERVIYTRLKKANKNAAFILKNYPVSRSVSNDGFIRIFKKIFPDTSYSFETITRSRRFVQNTKKIFPRNGQVVTWEKAIAELKKDGFTIQENLFERV